MFSNWELLWRARCVAEVLGVLLELYHDRLPEDVRRALLKALGEAESVRNSVLIDVDPLLRPLILEKLENEPSGSSPGFSNTQQKTPKQTHD